MSELFQSLRWEEMLKQIKERATRSPASMYGSRSGERGNAASMSQRESSQTARAGVAAWPTSRVHFLLGSVDVHRVVNDLASRMIVIVGMLEN
jgi:hypothetical protein